MDEQRQKSSTKALPIYPFMSYKSWRFIPWPVFRDGNIEKQFQLLHNFTPKDNAVLLCSPWKSDIQLIAKLLRPVKLKLQGTHWIYEIICMLLKQSAEYSATDEGVITTHVDNKTETELLKMSDESIIHSHLPLSFQSNRHVENGGKIICFNRNPKDQHVSFFNWLQGKLGVPKNWRWNDYYMEFVLKDDLNTGWFNYTKEMIHAVESECVTTHYLTYESLTLDTKNQVVKLARFLEVPYTNECIDEIINKCSFENMKKYIPSASVFTGLTDDFRKDYTYELLSSVLREHIPNKAVTIRPKDKPWMSNEVRRAFRFLDSPIGKIGDWKNWFTVAQNEQFDAIYAKQMRNTNVEFIFE